MTREEFDRYIHTVRTAPTLEDAGAAAAGIWFDLNYAQKQVEEARESVKYHRVCTNDYQEAARLDDWLERNRRGGDK